MHEGEGHDEGHKSRAGGNHIKQEPDESFRRLDPLELVKHHDPEAVIGHIRGSCGQEEGSTRELMVPSSGQCTDHYGQRTGKSTQSVVDSSPRRYSRRERVYLEVDDPGEGKKYMCAGCGKQYTRKQVLKDHYKAIHENQKFICHICGDIFNQRRSHRLHMFYKHDLDPPKTTYQCDDCNKHFRNKSDLDGHVNAIHLKIAPFQCKLCGQCYPSTCALRHHNCPCNRGSHPCDTCGKVFDQKSGLKQHHRNVHGVGQRIRDCTTCGRSFKDGSNFIKHKKRCKGKHLEASGGEVLGR